MHRILHGIRRSSCRPVASPLAFARLTCPLPFPLINQPFGYGNLLPSGDEEADGDLLPSGDEEADSDLLPYSGANQDGDSDLLPQSGDEDGEGTPPSQGDEIAVHCDLQPPIKAKSENSMGTHSPKCSGVDAGAVAIFNEENGWCTTGVKMKMVHLPPSSPLYVFDPGGALKLDYLDLYLIHWPLKFSKQPPALEDIEPLDIQQTWQCMEKCVELGLAKAIGVSNFSSKKVMELLQIAKIPPAVNQVEMHPKLQQKQLRETCRKADIQVAAFSALGAPQTKWGSSAVIDDPVIKAIAEKHGKTPAQVALRWGVQQGVVVISKSYNRARVAENFQILDWSLTDEDLQEIEKFEQKRNNPGPFLADGSFYNDSGLWDGED